MFQNNMRNDIAFVKVIIDEGTSECPWIKMVIEM